MHIETQRLRLRVCEEPDRDHFVTFNADPIVVKGLGGPLSRDDSDAKLDRYLKAWESNGYGRWLVEAISGTFLGYCGVMPVREDLCAPVDEDDEADRGKRRSGRQNAAPSGTTSPDRPLSNQVSNQGW